MAATPDEEILAFARQRQDIVVTLDAEFHQLLAESQETSPSVVRIRMEGLKGDRLAAILVQVIQVAATELNAGAVVSVTPSRIRVRSLPIGR